VKDNRGWFWKQVLIAVAVGVLGGVRQHWPYLCYAIAGTAMPHFLWRTVQGAPALLRWWALPWPLSQLVFEVTCDVLLALAALPVLAVALLINQEFHWISLFRTGVINMAVIAFGKYSLGLLYTFPWLLRPTADPHVMRILMLPPPSLELLLFSSFLYSAWLGCRSPRNTTLTINPV
jgi:hypothetical protein